MSEYELCCEERLVNLKKTIKEKEKCGAQWEAKNFHRLAYICKKEIKWINQEIYLFSLCLWSCWHHKSILALRAPLQQRSQVTIHSGPCAGQEEKYLLPVTCGTEALSVWFHTWTPRAQRHFHPLKTSLLFKNRHREIFSHWKLVFKNLSNSRSLSNSLWELLHWLLFHPCTWRLLLFSGVVVFVWLTQSILS